MQIHRNLQVPNDRIKWNSRVSHWIISYWPELASRRNHGEFLGGKNRGDESFHTTFVWRHLMPERLCANCGSVPASRHAKTDAWIVEITPVCADCPCKDDAAKIVLDGHLCCWALPLFSSSAPHPLRHEVAFSKFISLMLMQRRGPTILDHGENRTICLKNPLETSLIFKFRLHYYFNISP